MELAILIYVIGVFSSLCTFCGIAAFVTICILAIRVLLSLVSGWNTPDDPFRKYPNSLFWLPVIFILFIFGTIFIPNEKTSYTMVGAYAAQKIYENPESKILQGKALLLINKKLDAYIEEKDNKK